MSNVKKIISEIEDTQAYKEWHFVNMIFSIINQYKAGKKLSPKQVKALETFLIKENGIDYEDYYGFDPVWDCNN